MTHVHPGPLPPSQPWQRWIHWRAALVVLAAVIAPALPAQIGAPIEASTTRDEDDLEACERFLSLRSTHKSTIVARIRGHLIHGDYPAYDRIYALRFDVWESADEKATPTFDAESRNTIPVEDPRSKKLRERFARTPLLGDLHVHVYYDWIQGKIVQRDVPPDQAQLFANLLNGYPPETDQAVAKVMEVLDQDKKIRKLADWFGHTYADRLRNAYPGNTLYDAWYSGEVVEVPDIDAIAFARNILKSRRHKAPLGGSSRDRLYETIGKSALEYRKYRTLREAAAAAFVHTAPPMDATYARLVPRFHYLQPTHGDDLQTLADRLAKSSRDKLIEEVDAKLEKLDSEAWKRAERRRAEIRAMRIATRAFALAELEAFAGPPAPRKTAPKKAPQK